MDQGHHHQQPQLHHQYSTAAASSEAGGGDRFPQWSIQETRDFLMIRAELDPNFMETKRNKLLWEVISTRMKEKGYSRSPEQCKCKWKNLVTRYKVYTYITHTHTRGYVCAPFWCLIWSSSHQEHTWFIIRTIKVFYSDLSIYL